MPHQVRRSIANETATLLVIPAVAVTLVAAQLAPVPSHIPGRAQPADVVAVVNGATIRAGDLDAAMNTVVPLSSYHQNLKPQKLDELRRQALDGLIDEELKYQEAVRLNVRVADGDVEQALARAKKSYRNEQEFERARQASGATLPQIRASIQRALMIQRVYDDQVGARCRVTEAQAAAFYRDNPARFVMPEQLRVSLITIGVDPSAPPADWERARQKVRDLAQRLAGGASFAALAREFSSDESRSKGGDLGFVHRGQLIDEFERALRDLAPGRVSPVVQTIYGFHLLRLIETRPPAQKTFADVKATIVRDLTETRCAQAAAAWSKNLRARARVVVGNGGDSGRPAPVAAATQRK
ncbi:MAG TPA: peptidylprolyl isomerase [Vicinamibacterales bacterium]|nr:peptidylprolyl isomerase [Vicinamibacterales bacterium]